MACLGSGRSFFRRASDPSAKCSILALICRYSSILRPVAFRCHEAPFIFCEFANLVIRVRQTKYLLPDPIGMIQGHFQPLRVRWERTSVREVEEAAKEQHGIFTIQHLKLVRVECHHWRSITTPHWCTEVVVYPWVWSPPTSPGLGGPFGHGTCFTCLFIWLTLFRLGTSEVEEGTPDRGTILYGYFGILIFIACTDYYCYSLIDLLLSQVLADEWHPVLM